MKKRYEVMLEGWNLPPNAAGVSLPAPVGYVLEIEEDQVSGLLPYGILAETTKPLTQVAAPETPPEPPATEPPKATDPVATEPPAPEVESQKTTGSKK